MYSVMSSEAGLETALARLWGPILPTGWNPNRKFRWYYRDNPKGPGKMFLLACGNGGENVVGCAGIANRMVYVNGTPLRAALLADLGVEREHRTAMPALALQRAVRSHCRSAYAFSYGFPNAHALRVYARIGYREVGKLTRYARVLRHAEYVRRRVGSQPLANAAGWFLDVPSRLRAGAASIRRPRSRTIEWVESADGRFDALWQRAKDQFAVVEYRGADYLRWRFFGHPSRAFDTAVLADRVAGTIHAYAVIERVGDSANMWDVFGESDDDVRTLLDGVALAMRQRGAFALSVYTVGSRLGDLLVSSGFLPRDANKTLVIDVSESSAAARNVLLDAANWFIADGGEDS